jgi:hypothetical protein
MQKPNPVPFFSRIDEIANNSILQLTSILEWHFPLGTSLQLTLTRKTEDLVANKMTMKVPPFTFSNILNDSKQVYKKHY